MVELPQQIIAPPLPEVTTESPIPAAPIFSAAAAADAGFGTTCDVAATLERGFGGDPELSAELARIGPRSRSVANAIMVWDGDWVDLSADAPKASLEIIRQAIIEAIRAAPPECVIEEVAGPRFISVSGNDGTTVLVLGSGSWQWDQLILKPPPPPVPAKTS